MTPTPTPADLAAACTILGESQKQTYASNSRVVAVAAALARARAEGHADGVRVGREEAADLVIARGGPSVLAVAILEMPAPTPEPAPTLTNCDSCRFDYGNGAGRMCDRMHTGDAEQDEAVAEWIADDDNVDEKGSPLPGATGCPGYAPKPAPTPEPAASGWRWKIGGCMDLVDPHGESRADVCSSTSAGRWSVCVGGGQPVWLGRADIIPYLRSILGNDVPELPLDSVTR